MRFDRVEDVVNVISKTVYYIKVKNGYSYQIRLLIYDAKFNVKSETTRAMTWISFPDLK